MGLYNQDFHIFQRQFLNGLYESSSRKTQETRVNTILINFYEDNRSRTYVHD